MKKQQERSWPLISVVVATYDRAHLLKATLDSFRRTCTYTNLEFIISDNHSRPDQLNLVLQERADFYVVAGRNRSLGGNNNQGLRQARGDYHFYLQDDWACTQRGDWMQEALEVLERYPDVGLVHCRVVEHITSYESARLPSGRELRLLDFEQPAGKYSHYVYNDGPQLKRRDFHEKVGWYEEDIPIGETEDRFCRQFLRQRLYRIAAIDFRRADVQLFEHIGDYESTRPDRWRHRWRHKLGQSTAGRVLLSVYGHVPEAVRAAMHKSFWMKRTGGPSTPDG